MYDWSLEILAGSDSCLKKKNVLKINYTHIHFFSSHIEYCRNDMYNMLKIQLDTEVNPSHCG